VVYISESMQISRSVVQTSNIQTSKQAKHGIFPFENVIKSDFDCEVLDAPRVIWMSQKLERLKPCSHYKILKRRA